MSIDYQQLSKQIKELGENAPIQQQELQRKRQEAAELLKIYAQEGDVLRLKVQEIVRKHDSSLRCAVPAGSGEPLDGHYHLPPLPPTATLLAADGSQINYNRHAEVDYSLINVGAIQMRLGSAAPPQTFIECKLFYDEQLYNQTDATLALSRDLNERSILARLADQAEPPVITFTDGPVELWGVRDASAEETTTFQESMVQYLQALNLLWELRAITAGYVDKPAANLVVRLLEIARATPEDLEKIRHCQPLRGVTDKTLFWDLLAPGERSAVFALQSQSAKSYPGPLALHFFYLNVGRLGHPWLARVEIPAWVAEERQQLDTLHAVLIDQCRMLGARPYPYLLHRAHETALVRLEERDQVTQMIALELRRRGVSIEGSSHKQFAKDQPGRTRK
jgi:hypothetical protein